MQYGFSWGVYVKLQLIVSNGLLSQRCKHPAFCLDSQTIITGNFVSRAEWESSFGAGIGAMQSLVTGSASRAFVFKVYARHYDQGICN